MKTKLPSAFSLQPSAFALLVLLPLFTAAPRAPAQTVWTNALSLDGVDDYVRVADADRLDLTNNYTLECWFQAAGFGGLRGLIGKYHTPNANGYLLRLTGNNLDFDAKTTTSLNLQTGVWYHVAAVNSNGTRRLYLDGQSQSLSGTVLTVQANTNPLCLGRDYLADSGRVLNGQMDEVRIWNAARSQAEIQSTMRQPLSGTESNLVAYYRFDEGTGLTAYDATTNHFDGTLTNGPTWVLSTVPAAPVITLGYLSGITTVSARLCGLVNPGNLPTTVWFEWGATTNYGNVTSATELSATNVLLEVSQPISGLTPGTHYDYRQVASNALGVATRDGAFHTAWPTARYVNAAGTNATPPYTNWTSAATNIQDAVNAALPLDEVVVTNGTYGPVWVAQPVALRSVNGPAVTLINGAGVTNGAVLADGASLSGFTLTNGFAVSGGGVYCMASATVSNCVLTGNAATTYGGGACYGTLNNCVLTGNSATNGGGAYQATLNNCVLSGNSSASQGGGVYQGTLNNCVLTSNSATDGGGVSRATLNHCTLTANSADLRGGGGYECTWRNCIIYFNAAPAGANYFYTFIDTVNLDYCCTTPLPPTNGVGNITLDPELAGVSHLSADSPCRGAGSAAYATGTDLDGEAWANPPSIGCDEYHPGAVTGPLAVAIAATRTNVAAHYPVALTARIDGRTAASAWDLGGGMVLSNQPYALRAWATPGDYPVILRAWNESLPGGVSATVTVHVVTAPVLYVAPGSTNPVPPYASWATAATNLQDAVNALDASAVPGTWVLATNGTYAPVTVPRPAFLCSVNGPEFTTINGGGTARCVDLADGAGLSGFTLTNGYTSDGGGGGVRCASAHTWVTNCVITGNYGRGGGGGAFWGTLDHCTLTGNRGDGLGRRLGGGGAQGGILNHCTLSTNTAVMNVFWNRGGGGAADAFLNDCTLNGNIVTNSTAFAGTGGGASFSVLNRCMVSNHLFRAWPVNGAGAYASTLSDCTLYGNEVAGINGVGGLGGGAHACTLNHCLLHQNSSRGGGGGGAYASSLNRCTLTFCFSEGLTAGGAESSTLNNCLLWNGGWYAVANSTLNNCTVAGVYAGALNSTLNNCIVYDSPLGNFDSSSVLNYCCTTPMPTNGIGNTTNAPLFVDLAGGDLHLQSNSPCINAGNNALVISSDDLDGNPRILGGTVDIGAYECTSPPLLTYYTWLQTYGLSTYSPDLYVDSDGDRLNNWQEWRCWTDPTNALSVLRLLPPSFVGSDVNLTWPSVPGLIYFLECSTNLSTTPYFTPLATNLPGQPGTTTFTDTNAAGPPPRFYRVGVPAP